MECACKCICQGFSAQRAVLKSLQLNQYNLFSTEGFDEELHIPFFFLTCCIKSSSEWVYFYSLIASHFHMRVDSVGKSNKYPTQGWQQVFAFSVTVVFSFFLVFLIMRFNNLIEQQYLINISVDIYIHVSVNKIKKCPYF